MSALAALAAEYGIVRRYWDGAGREAHAPDATLVALLAALGVAAGTEAEAAAALDTLHARRDARVLPDWAVVEAGVAADIALQAAGPVDWRLETEAGEIPEGRAEGRVTLPPLEAGYHRLSAGGARMPVLAAPARLPEVPRGWGVMAPLYGLRPVGQGGIGDYADLAAAADSLGRAGAGFLGINPVHAGFPGDKGNFSPYAPSSRERFSTMHIAVPGAGGAPDGALIDYAACVPVQQAALEAAFDAFLAAGGDPGFDDWRAAEGAALERFAIHQALAERYGPYWPDWPMAYRSPDTPVVGLFAASQPRDIAAHAWRQWMAERQLGAARDAAQAAGMRHGLYLDLAVGTHPGGAETWADPGLFARGVSLGAPPDPFGPDGQVWNLAPMRPDVLAARGFSPVARILRRQLRYAGVLRIDHILGFERGYWVPDGLPGAYVTMPKAALLAVARIEAARAGAVIVGEDLGAIPDGLRGDLAASGILGCRVAMFERAWEGDRGFIAPELYAELAVSSFGSHDTPLWLGWRAGRDIGWREALGRLTPDQARAERDERARDVARFDDAAGTQDGALVGLARFLARAASRLVAIQAEDLAGMDEQPNLPGTVHDHPNWRRRLPLGPQALGDATLLKQIAAIMAEHGR